MTGMSTGILYSRQPTLYYFIVAYFFCVHEVLATDDRVYVCLCRAMKRDSVSFLLPTVVDGILSYLCRFSFAAVCAMRSSADTAFLIKSNLNNGCNLS